MSERQLCCEVMKSNFSKYRCVKCRDVDLAKGSLVREGQHQIRPERVKLMAPKENPDGEEKSEENKTGMRVAESLEIKASQGPSQETSQPSSERPCIAC